MGVASWSGNLLAWKIRLFRLKAPSGLGFDGTG
jgi:hypothetical protein